MRSIIDGRLHPAAWLVTGDTRRSMMDRLDASVDAAVLVGCHTRHGRSGAPDRTITARDIYEVRIAGRPVGEIGLKGLAAGAARCPARTGGAPVGPR